LAPDQAAAANPSPPWFNLNRDPDGARGILNRESAFSFMALDDESLAIGGDQAEVAGSVGWQPAPPRRRRTISR